MESTFKKIVAEIEVTGFFDCRDYLGEIYVRIKAKDGLYSHKRFALDLGFAGTNITYQWIKGKRPLTVKAATKIAGALGLAGIQKKFFLTLVEHAEAKLPADRDRCLRKLYEIKNTASEKTADSAMMVLCSEWYHPIIREMVSQKDFDGNPEWIAKKIHPSIRPQQARESLALLEKHGFIRKDAKTGKWHQVGADVNAGHRTPGLAIIQYHQWMLDLSKQSIVDFSPEERDVSAVTISISKDGAQRLKSMIHAFQLQLLAEARKDESNADEIHQVNIQLFPVKRS